MFPGSALARGLDGSYRRRSSDHEPTPAAADCDGRCHLARFGDGLAWPRSAARAEKEPRAKEVHESPLRKLEGGWELVAIRHFGSEIKYVRETDTVLDNPTIEKGLVTLPIDLDVESVGVAYAKFELRDASKDSPLHSQGWIDLVNQDDGDLARKMRGIYKTEGNILMICFNPTGGSFDRVPSGLRLRRISNSSLCDVGSPGPQVSMLVHS